jgi:hypothetical protein
MAFWRLRVTKKLIETNSSRFYASLDCSEMVILASSAREARQLTFEESAENWWLRSADTTCTELLPGNRPQIILANWPPLN